MQLKLRRAACWALGIAVLVVALPQSSHGEEWPGLPDSDGTFSQAWGGAAQGGLSYAKRAKQWVRTPDSMVTFRSELKTGERRGDWVGPHSTTCASLCVRDYSVRGQAFLVSPGGAPADYGYLAPMTVRSVGFGLMPVEATVQVSQRRQDGYPIPFEASLAGEDHFDVSVQATRVSETGSSVDVDDAVNVRILKVLVDGVDLGLSGDCRTITPAPMTMTSPAYSISYVGISGEDQGPAQEEWFRTADPDSFFNPLWGGTLRGNITIPPFTGCTTASGDDLSALMTLSVSGPDNPVAARVGWTCSINDNGAGRPLRVGENTPKRAYPASVAATNDRPCSYGTQKFDYPTRDAD